MMLGLWQGARQILIPKYDVEMVLAALRDYQPTYFPAVPTIFVSLLNHPRLREFNLDRVCTFNSGSAPIAMEVIERFERMVNVPLNQGYGLSEASPVTHSTPHVAKRKPASIGLADARHRHEDRRPRHRHAGIAAGRRGRAVRGGSAGDEGLLETSRRDRDRAADRCRLASCGSTRATSRASTKTATPTSCSARRT